MARPSALKRKGRDEPEENGGAQDFFSRVSRSARRGVALLIRQSSPKQASENTGSPAWQKAQARVVRPYMVDGSEIREYDARGESAKHGANRPVFQQLLADARAGKIGIVIVAFVDRASRNWEDGEALFSALDAVGGFLASDGQFYDMRDANTRMALRFQLAIAAQANDHRKHLSATAKASKAVGLTYRIPLASGLVWASPDDPEYVKACNAAGLGHVLAREALAEHRASSQRKGLRHYVLPYPDADVHRAVTLAISWLLETRDLSEVLERIRTGDGWPEGRRGTFPMHRFSRFWPERHPVWIALDQRADGRNDIMRGQIYGWLRSPSLYGCYDFRSKVLQESSSEVAREMGSDIWVEGAFPGYAPPEALPAVLEILSAAASRPRRGTYCGPNLHGIADMRCSHPLPDGTVCGLRRRGWYGTGGAGYVYANLRCGRRGHGSSVPAQLEGTVFRLISDAYSADQLRAELDRIKIHGGSDGVRLRVLEREVSELNGDIETAARLVEEYGKAKATVDKNYWEKRRKEHASKLEGKLLELDRVRRSMRDNEELTRVEYAQLLELGNDIPELVRRASGHPALLRDLSRTLAQAVHVRRLGAFVYHVEVEFPSGQRCGDVVFCRRVDYAQPLALLAYQRLRRWADAPGTATHDEELAAHDTASKLADEVNAASGGSQEGTRWTAQRILAAALHHVRAGAGVARKGAHEGANALSTRLGVAERRVSAAILEGKLGPARMVGAELAVRSDPHETHRAFPDVALRDVAERNGWAVEDTVALDRIRTETGTRWHRIERMSEQGAGVVRDDYGRRYTRRSMLAVRTASELAATLWSAIPAGADPESGEWLTMKAAQARMPGLNHRTIMRHATIVRPGFGEFGERTVYVWVDGTVEERFRALTLEQAVAALRRPELRLEEFIPRDEALASFGRRFGYPSVPTWQRAASEGRILEVKASLTGWGRALCFVHLPQSVWTADNPEVVRRFLKGEYRIGELPPNQ